MYVYVMFFLLRDKVTNSPIIPEDRGWDGCTIGDSVTFKESEMCVCELADNGLRNSWCRPVTPRAIECALDLTVDDRRNDNPTFALAIAVERC